MKKILSTILFLFGTFPLWTWAQQDTDSCYTPLGVTVTNITPYSAEIAWTEAGDATHWSIEYGVGSFTQGTGTLVLTDSNSFTLTGLLANHTYNVYVRSDCDTDSHSEWTDAYTFSTPCYEIDHFPFTENFNAKGTGNGIHDLPECWGRLNSQSVEIQFSAPSSGRLCFIYYPGIAVSPRIADFDTNGNPIDIRYLKLDLDVSYYDETNHLTVGVLTDPNDASTFQVVKEINVGYTFSSYLLHDEVFFHSYTGNGRYIAIKNQSGSYASADNFVLSQHNYDCAPPDNLGFEQIGSGSALVTWQAGQVGNAQEYTLQFREQGDSTWGIHDHLTNTSFFLTGLTPRTWYDVRVKTRCSDSLYGDWATSSFHTECFSGGYVTIGNSSNHGIYIPNWDYSVTRQLYYPNDFGGPGYIYSASFRVFQPTTPQRAWKLFLQYTNQSDFYFGDAPFDNLPYTQVFAGPVDFHDGWITIYFDTPFYYNGTSNLVLTIQDTTGFSAASANQFYYSFCSHLSNATGHAYTPDAQFNSDDWMWGQDRLNVIFQTDCDSSVTCGAPNLLVDSVGGNGARLIWAAGYQENQWELEYKKTSDTVWTTYNNPTGFQVTLTGLQLNTSYVARMRSICDTENYSNWTSISFTTGCGNIEVLPYSVDFESNITNNFVECWQRLGQVSVVNYNSVTGTTNNHSLNLLHNPANTPYALAVLPRLSDNFTMSNLAVTLNTQCNNNGLFEVGVMTDPADTGSFVSVSGWQPAWGWTEYLVPLTSYTGSGKYIALRMRSTSSSTVQLNVDDLVVDVMPFCPRPADLAVTNVSTQSVTLQWSTYSSSATSWHVEYGPMDFTLGTGTSLTVTDSSVTLSGLNPATAYTCCVRADCGSELSAWQCISFSTDCDLTTPPYFENFETVTGTFPDCWSQQFDTGSVEWTVVNPTSNPTGAHGGVKAICIKNNSYTSFITTLVSPTLNLQSLNNATLRFWHVQKKWVNDQDTLAFLYRTSPSDEWTLLVSYNQDIPSWTLDSVLLPNLTSTYQVAFQGTVRYGYGIFLDDISITGEMIPDTCAPAADLTVTDIGNHDLTLSWAPDGEADHWTVFYRETGANAWDSVTVSAPPVTISELQGVTEYEVFVRTYCEDGVPTSTDTITVSTTNIGIAGYDNSITLLPNPTTGLLTVTSSQDLITRIEICDLAGSTVVSSHVEKENAVRTDVSELPDGVYIVKIYTETSFAVCKLIKK